MLYLCNKNHAIGIEAFNYTSIYLDDLLNNDNGYFERMISQIIQLNSSCQHICLIPKTHPFRLGLFKNQCHSFI